MKNLIIQCQNNENHETSRIPLQNFENHANSNISHYDHATNNEKFIEFHTRIKKQNMKT